MLDEARLRQVARQLRANIIRMITIAGSGHPGGSLSAIDALTYLYFHRMRIDPAKPRWEDRDRFVLSKGHCCPALYASLAGRGYFPEELLWTLRDTGSLLQGHPDMRKTPGVDMTTGSLGQGFSSAAGMALAGKVMGKDYRVYAMISDGECQAGIVWEAAMAAAHNRLDNLTAIVDYNRLQTDGVTCEIMNIEPLVDKWLAFGWQVAEANAHDFPSLDAAFEAVVRPGSGVPGVVIGHSVKGKGVAEMENQVGWHSGAPSKEDAERFVAEILAEARA